MIHILRFSEEYVTKSGIQNALILSFVGKSQISSFFSSNFISVNTSDELEKLSPFIARFLRLESIRVEFPKFLMFSHDLIIPFSTQNASENSIIELYKAIGHCSFLKCFGWNDIK